MRKPTCLCFLLLLAASLRPGSATTALPIEDSLLADQATVIAEGTVTASGPSSRPGRPATEYRLRVERLVKGEIPESTLVVRVPGGVATNTLKLKVWGAPELRIGERALLFLVVNPDGSYGPLHLSLGAFHELRSGRERLAIRDLSEIEVEQDEEVRDLGRFADWLEDRAAGVERAADYFAHAPKKMKRAAGEFTYLGGTKQRWLEFDRQQDIVWKAEVSGQAGLAGGGFADFQAALQAWNADPSTNIRYRYKGTTTVTAGFQGFDGVNAILFEDPNRETPGTFTCPRPGGGAGVLAIGGTWFDDSTSPGVPAVITEADIVINDGAGCWFTTGKRAEQVYAHELGHTLGLGHSCGDGRSGACDTPAKSEALMRATVHPDDRGARLGDDDRAAILTLYSGTDSGGPFVASSEALCLLGGRFRVQVRWKNGAENGAGTAVPLAGSARTGMFWFFGAENIELIVKVLDGTSVNGFYWTFYGGLSDVEYWVIVTDTQTGESRTYHNPKGRLCGGADVSSLPAPVSESARPVEQPAFTATDAACAPGALCLMGGRFQVEVAWQLANGQQGMGTPVPLTDQSGLFWFFGPENIELVVKTLDGQAVNGKHWFFYGALSDVAYQIKVTDTTTGARKIYSSPAGNVCGRGDTSAF